MRKNLFSANKFDPPPPTDFFYSKNVGNSIFYITRRKHEMRKHKFNNFFNISNKIQTTSHQFQKLYNTPPWRAWRGARTCKVSRKYSNGFLSYSTKTKRDGQTDGQTDGWMDGGHFNISHPGFGAAGDNKERLLILYNITT